MLQLSQEARRKSEGVSRLEHVVTQMKNSKMMTCVESEGVVGAS